MELLVLTSDATSGNWNCLFFFKDLKIHLNLFDDLIIVNTFYNVLDFYGLQSSLVNRFCLFQKHYVFR